LSEIGAARNRVGVQGDASLHPALVAELIRLFQDPKSNPRRAQLVFNTHDATILGDSTSDRLIGRDQVWFTEKRADDSTRVYPLSDLDPRKEEAIGRRYLAGRYGLRQSCRTGSSTSLLDSLRPAIGVEPRPGERPAAQASLEGRPAARTARVR
jgi:hypothetical protein